jgi:hypothetical protein
MDLVVGIVTGVILTRISTEEIAQRGGGVEDAAIKMLQDILTDSKRTKNKKILAIMRTTNKRLFQQLPDLRARQLREAALIAVRKNRPMVIPLPQEKSEEIVTNIRPCWSVMTNDDSVDWKAHMESSTVGNFVIHIITPQGSRYACLNHDEIKREFKFEVDDTTHYKVWHPCRNDDGYVNRQRINRDVSYVKLTLGSLGICYIAKPEWMYSDNDPNARMFTLVKRGSETAMVTNEVLDFQGDWISADHCQNKGVIQTYELCEGDTEQIHGTMEWAHGHRYDGEWKNGKRHGQGMMVWTYDRGLCIYRGEWADDTIRGTGSLHCTDLGDYSKNETQKFSDKTWTQKNVQKHNDLYVFELDDVNTSIWVSNTIFAIRNNIKGTGRMITMDGEYRGGMKHVRYEVEEELKVTAIPIKRHGKGVLTAGEKTGETYVRYTGEWVNDERHGKGRMVIMEKNIGPEKMAVIEEYSGYWENDERHGKGLTIRKIWITSHKTIFLEKYRGHWKNGVRHGEGKSVKRKTIKNKTYETSVYAGHWENNKKHGHGKILILMNDPKLYYKGVWNMGMPEFDESAKHNITDRSNFISLIQDGGG